MKDLRIGIIGAGGIARGHGKRLRAMEGVEIAALADPSEKSLADFTRAVFDGCDPPPVYDDYRRMLEEEDLGAVLIATPHTLHCDQIMDSLDAGLHVLAEKPLACTEGETLRIIERSEAAGRHVVVSFQRRFRALYRRMKEFIHGRDFGNVLFVASFLSQGWLTAQRGTWRQMRLLSGGGQLNDSGAHIIDMMMWMLEDEAEEVSAFIDNRGREVDIDSAISFRTRKGAVGTLSVVGSGPQGFMWEDMSVSSDSGRAIYFRNGRLFLSEGHSTDMRETDMPGEDSNPDRHFVDVVTGRSRNESPPRDFLRNIRFTEAAWKSAAEGGRPVRIANQPEVISCKSAS